MCSPYGIEQKRARKGLARDKPSLFTHAVLSNRLKMTHIPLPLFPQHEKEPAGYKKHVEPLQAQPFRDCANTATATRIPRSSHLNNIISGGNVSGRWNGEVA